MLVFLDVYSKKIEYMEKDRVDIILKNLKMMITDDHQYNILLFEHMFGYSLCRDSLIMDKYIEEYNQRRITIAYEPRNLIIDIVNMRVNSVRTSYEWSNNKDDFTNLFVWFNEVYTNIRSQNLKGGHRICIYIMCQF